MKFLKSIAAALAVCMILPATGCDKKSGGEENSSAADPSVSRVQTERDVKLKSYEFPEFLENTGDADVLSNPIYKSFDSALLMVEPEKQPFDGYRCTACFADNYYIFKDEENYGLLSSEGVLLIDPEGIKKITAAAADLLQIRYEDSSTDYFRVYPDVGGGEFVTIDDFDLSRISFSKRMSPGDDPQEVYVLQLDGWDIYDAEFTSFEAAELGELDTSKQYEAVYKAHSGKTSYYIAFDRLYNITVFEAEYAFIALKIGGVYGECYVLSQDDYTELETLLSSFGRESYASAPSKDENEDYIQITMGLADNSRRVMTISSDGYCLTDNITNSSEASNKYFTVMNPETFADLVNWTKSTLGAEYEE